MKKLFFISLLAFLSFNAYSQTGDISIGARGSYVTVYKDFLYGLDFSYHVADPLEITLSALMNPDVVKKEDFYPDEKLGLYSASLDVRYYMLLQRTWATGPSLGGQYLHINYKENNLYNENALGFNIGWHLRVNLSDNIKINGGWRYTNSQYDTSHHSFYLGLCYTFNIF